MLLLKQMMTCGLVWTTPAAFSVWIRNHAATSWSGLMGLTLSMTRRSCCSQQRPMKLTRASCPWSEVQLLPTTCHAALTGRASVTLSVGLKERPLPPQPQPPPQLQLQQQIPALWWKVDNTKISLYFYIPGTLVSMHTLEHFVCMIILN